MALVLCHATRILVNVSIMVAIGGITHEGDILLHQSKSPFQTKGVDEIDTAVHVVVSRHTSLMDDY